MRVSATFTQIEPKNNRELTGNKQGKRIYKVSRNPTPFKFFATRFNSQHSPILRALKYSSATHRMRFFEGMSYTDIGFAPFSTTIKASRHRTNHRLARIQKRRFESFNNGRFWRRLRTTNCCRRHMFSAISCARDLKHAEAAATNHCNTICSCLLLF